MMPVCCICGNDCENEFGNNPDPVVSESSYDENGVKVLFANRCCDRCNMYYVIPTRLGRLSRAAAQDLIDMEEE